MDDLPLNAEEETKVRGGAGTDGADLNRLLAGGQLRPPPPKLPPDPPKPN